MSNEAEGYFTRFNPNTVWLGNAREVLGVQPEPVVEDQTASPEWIHHHNKRLRRMQSQNAVQRTFHTIAHALGISSAA